MNFKLICIDMDGTLLDKEHKISEENKMALLEAHNKGVVIAFTTGRLFNSAKNYYDCLNIKGPIIAANGTYIHTEVEEKCIYKSAFSYDELSLIYKITKENDVPCYFYTFDTALSEEKLPANHPYVIGNKIANPKNRIKLIDTKDLLNELKNYAGEVIKTISIENNEDKFDNLFKVKEKIKNLGIFEVVSSGNNNFEIMKKDSSKGNAVRILSEYLHIKKEEIICIGDNENDLSMIEYAGLGIAMGNATDSLKKKANYITDTNLNSGVAKAIKKFILD